MSLTPRALLALPHVQGLPQPERHHRFSQSLQCTATPAVQGMLLRIQNLDLNSLGVVWAILRCKITLCVHTHCVPRTCLDRCGAFLI